MHPLGTGVWDAIRLIDPRNPPTSPRGWDEAVVQKLSFIQPIHVPEREGDRVGRVLRVRENRHHVEVPGRHLLFETLVRNP